MRIRGRLASVAIAVLAVVAPTIPVRGADDARATIETLVALDRRVFAIGTPLARAAAPLCPDGRSTGLMIALASQFGGRYRAAAATLLGSDTAPVVQFALPPAAIVVAAGDRIVAIERSAVAGGTGFARSERVADQLEAGARDGRLALRVENGGGQRDVVVDAAPACDLRLDVRPGDGVDANANGRYVQLSSALVQSVDDVGLAALIAHELAHNILRHPQLLTRIGGGILPGFSRAGRTIRATETQADRVSLYILARAGYRLADVVAFWRDFARRGDLGLLSDRTHPDWRSRTAALEAEAARIAAMRARGEPVLPPAALLQSVERTQR